MTTEVCYVIGSGPSLRGFDFDTLPDGHRIGANKSAWLANCDTLVSVDRNFYRNFKTEITTFPGAAYIACDSRSEVYPNVTYWQPTRDEFSWQEGLLPTSNSGLAALNLAILLGYTEIALLGFDFKWDDRTSHFHDGYPNQTFKVDGQLKGWATIFSKIAPEVKKRNIRVTNFIGANGTRVQAFPTAPLEELV